MPDQGGASAASDGSRNGTRTGKCSMMRGDAVSVSIGYRHSARGAAMVTSRASATAKLETATVGTPDRRSGLSWSVLFAAAVVALAAVAFSPILANGWVNWDDDNNF